MKPIRNLNDVKLAGKRVLVRLDLNVPLKKVESGAFQVADDTRIREALPTIKYCLDQNAKVILCSHLGRPDGQRSKEFSLEPVAAHLSELLEREVLLSEDIVGDGVHHMVQHSRDHQLILLENLRFHKEEEENDPQFSEQLAKLADVYVSDAFGTAHRKHASTYGVPGIVSQAACGFLIEKELKFLDKLINQPKHPYVVIAGGAKVTDKIKALDHLLNFVDQIIIGGAMSYAFLVNQGKNIGKSKCETEGVAAAEQIMKRAQAKKVEILLPSDHKIVYPEADPEWKKIAVTKDIPPTAMALDIGPETIARYSQVISTAKTIFWNGPMGFFEKDGFGDGTKAIAQAIGKAEAVRVAGGGDTLNAVSTYAVESCFDLLSTGGGASLKYLEGKGLPGIEIMRGK